MRSLLLVLFASLTVAGTCLASFEWRQFEDDPSQVALWNNGVQVGNLKLADATFYRHVAPGQWQGPVACPIGIPAAFLKTCKRSPESSCCDDECPCCSDNCTCATSRHCGKQNCHCVLCSAEASVTEQDGTKNYGVDMKEISSGKHLLNGKEVSRRQLIDALTAASVPDDANLLFVTVIGSDEARKQVVADFNANPALQPFKGKYRLQNYAPDHWAVKDAGFYTQGSPTIYLQQPDGKVLHRQDRYDGPEDLAKTLAKVTELREKKDGYDSSKDPDLRKGLENLLDWFKNLPPVAWMIGGLVILFLLLRNPSQSASR